MLDRRGARCKPVKILPSHHHFQATYSYSFPSGVAGVVTATADLSASSAGDDVFLDGGDDVPVAASSSSHGTGHASNGAGSAARLLDPSVWKATGGGSDGVTTACDVSSSSGSVVLAPLRNVPPPSSASDSFCCHPVDNFDVAPFPYELGVVSVQGGGTLKGRFLKWL